MDYAKVWEYAGRISVCALLIFVLISGSQGIWVYGTTYRDMVADRDQWKTLAIKGAVVAQKASQPPFGYGAAGLPSRAVVVPDTPEGVAAQLDKVAEAARGNPSAD